MGRMVDLRWFSNSLSSVHDHVDILAVDGSILGGITLPPFVTTDLSATGAFGNGEEAVLVW